MPDTSHEDCDGTMFPSTLQFNSDGPIAGKAFAFQLLKAGELFRSGHRVSHDVTE
jgi:hypothetical protein